MLRQWKLWQRRLTDVYYIYASHLFIMDASTTPSTVADSQMLMHRRRGPSKDQAYLRPTFVSNDCSVLFSALLASRVGRIMHDVPPTSSVFRHSYQVLMCSSGPCSYIVHPVDPRSSLYPTSQNRALDDLLFQA